MYQLTMDFSIQFTFDNKTNFPIVAVMVFVKDVTKLQL
jgi:hypothetical protein